MAGLVCIIIGAIIGFFNFFSYIGDDSAIRQTVQYLGYLIATILIVGGLILMKLTMLMNFLYYNKNKKNNNNKQKSADKGFEMKEESSVDTSDKEVVFFDNGDWKCPICGAINSKDDIKCYCGYKRSVIL